MYLIILYKINQKHVFFTFPVILYSLYRKKMITRLKICEKMIGHGAHFDLPLTIIYLSGVCCWFSSLL